MPSIDDIFSISVWVYKDVEQPAGSLVYLLDARWAATEGGLSSEVIGFTWVGFYVNGQAANKTWDSIPAGEWSHLHVQADEQFSGQVMFMTRVNSGPNTNSGSIDGAADGHSGFLKGALCELYYWSRHLDVGEINRVAMSFNRIDEEHGLIHYYPMEEAVQHSNMEIGLS
ncbi:hypothetical protein CYMTET_10649 [Cymbomonas tetramitiformis]|uniref:LamG domain-containing protein n=1 Tax=Cymbomonas tetramitiformis TaxID=36881 RepID=A0AAE0GNQ8_9CHLO|nr:hypothetical protein CYMTET_10649 [Cymbomonas tetramitiformis]